MKSGIRKMKEQDKEDVLNMMRIFYASEAVFTNGSEEIFLSDIRNCINDSPYLEGYIFEDDYKVQGYAMVAKSFSTEYGKTCIWVEDLYLKPEYRGQKIAEKFFQYIENKYPDTMMRLEVEKENEHAVHVYHKCGYEVLPYQEMIKHSRGL